MEVRYTEMETTVTRGCRSLQGYTEEFVCRIQAITLHLKQATQYWHTDNAHKRTLLMCAWYRAYGSRMDQFSVCSIVGSFYYSSAM